MNTSKTKKYISIMNCIKKIPEVIHFVRYEEYDLSSVLSPFKDPFYQRCFIDDKRVSIVLPVVNKQYNFSVSNPEGSYYKLKNNKKKPYKSSKIT